MNMPENIISKIGRRSFISKATIGIVTVCGFIITLLGFFIPIPKTGQQAKRLKIGRLEDYPVNRFTFLEKEKVFLFREREGVRAVSAKCTHLGCILKDNGHGFECPCHGSKYDLSGQVLSGPAPRELDWFQITKAPDGRMIIHIDRLSDHQTRFLRQKTTVIS